VIANGRLQFQISTTDLDQDHNMGDGQDLFNIIPKT
jgi:hypothetical protein